MSARAERLVAAAEKDNAARGRRYTHIAGLAVPYGRWASRYLFKERVARGAFTASLATKANPPLMAFHDMDAIPIGVAEPAGWVDRPDGLHGVWRLANTPEAQSIAAAIDDERMTGLSIGYQDEQNSWEYTANYDPDSGDVHKVTRLAARLLEVSVVPVPLWADAGIHRITWDRVEAPATEPQPALAAHAR